MSAVSIIMSTYNRQQFLARAIENVLNQTFTDFEFIIINDGSKDETKTICESYCKQDSRIRFIDLKENLGLSKARGMSIDLATADYIMFVDDDDICERTMVEVLFNNITQYNADISICGSVNDFGDRIEPLFVFDKVHLLNKVQGLEEFLKRELFHTAPPTKLFKRKLFKNVQFKSNVTIDDIHVIYKVFANAERTVVEGTPLYRFVKHRDNISGFIQTNKLKPKTLDEYLMMQDKRVVYLSNKVPEITQRVKYAAWSYMISMCDKIRNYNCLDCERQFESMMNVLRNNLSEFKNSPFITQREKDLLNKYIR